MLRACHKRCAEITLKVLEKNGGIFIKLGQHLVTPPVQHSHNLYSDANGHHIECHELPPAK